MDLVAKAVPHTTHVFGCSEDFWVLDWNEQGIQALGGDFSEKPTDLACENAKHRKLPPEIVSVCNVYDIEPESHSAELIVCCEVLEHLENPKAGLAALQRVATHNIIFSVPREPIWRALNMVRGKYLSDFGNTPGHIQHWSKNKFIELVGHYFDVIEVRTPIPWTMLLCRVRH